MRLTLCTILILLVSFTAHASEEAAFEYEGSTFAEVAEQLRSDVYEDKLPHKPVTVTSFYDGFTSLIFKAAQKTLEDHRDLRPRYQKLVHTIGVCLHGTWKITEKTNYGGHFATGSEGKIILRASEAMGLPVSQYRAFGLAGKVFPTMDENEKVKTGNFFTVDDLGGTEIKDFTKSVYLNEPKLTLRANLSLIAIGAATAKAFRAADSNAGIRQLYEISELGLDDPDTAITPAYLKLTGSKETERKTAIADFRRDLDISNFKNGLAFDISVRDTKEVIWSKIGQITIDETITSDSCDHRLHIHHPKWKD